ncbi:adenosylcobinamide-GDP ribazoletransferase [[Limnothrix rosea] IAM M-220]|uniref:adenosylcobinamide-GDP ribazoletransferase n=1 Tax=[Limnothrix rosea] IAM M-220 TaxID=454133 RepID=UPI00095A9438|nr:adenosylcobinamide-GDP ribazoletransferase [[Limnothrix rosea] IAM M-220]OKH12478.1 adenosylcobinamide-GDP ribazoletransferase [[Limnothrix rosea] IAM M-220]
MGQAASAFSGLWRSLLGAIIFYTIFPIPASWNPSFHRIARWCPLVGLIIGGLLSVVFLSLSSLRTPSLVTGAIITSLWVFVTGGLHLDGAMDSADGLAVTDPAKRLEVMTDSVTGAFGAMTAIIILLFKFAAIASLDTQNWWFLLIAPIWGRWSQVTAIAFFPYLKPNGKGAFHKQDFEQNTDFNIASLLTISTSVSLLMFWSSNTTNILAATCIAALIAICTSYWFTFKFAGHTGDTYGAIVEWTESLILIIISIPILQ